MKKEIVLLQEEMDKENIDFYLVPTSDDHNSEYVSDYFKCREYLSGFTGSAGTLLVSKDAAWLWTDGRYYLQAAKELEGSGITLMKDGTAGVLSIPDFLAKEMGENTTLAFNGKLYSTAFCMGLRRKLAGKNRRMKIDIDLVHKIWTDAPKRSCKTIYPFEAKYAGTPVHEKLTSYREYLKKHNADCQVLNGLTDIAWLFNLRGHDVACTPVFLAYAYIDLDTAILFLQKEAVSEETATYLEEASIEVKDYDSFYKFLGSLTGKKILMDQSDLNFYGYQSLNRELRQIPGQKYTTQAKIIKNDTEISNTKACHLRDAVYMTKFMYWLKHEIKKRNLTEIEVADYIDKLRLSDKLALDLSFETISAYGANAAIVHYTATEESNAIIEPKGLLLVDSGGHYLDGTTDITRTFAMGPLSDKERTMFTTVLRSMLHLANAKFLAGCRGSNLDCLAREPMWEMGIDFRHGTGHGVGHVLSVHEGPNNFRYRVTKANLDAILMPGMITTDEPGIYLDHQFGIRIENELLCTKWKQNEYGAFLKFDYLTYVPIDLDAIDIDLLSEQEKMWLNDYHSSVYDKIHPFLTIEEQEWLRKYTRAI
ncbi:MAG: aminopeptidase P family protein [Lachnospiraceae bacterium]|nr:aminopeptidase P family protein [Lachnospiraceae bacterium]